MSTAAARPSAIDPDSMAAGLKRSVVRSRLGAATATMVPALLAPRRSAVAVLLRFDRGPAEVLLMRRVKREGDRWSGHISFPGGMAQPEDADLLATATRETVEEVGLDLTAAAAPTGRLDERLAIASGKVIPMAISPFVFELTCSPTLRLGPEAEEAFWLPLAAAAAGELDGTVDYRFGPVVKKLPCWRYQGRTVWGLTWSMLDGLLAVVLNRPPHPDPRAR